jgi:hypothetical protein
VTRFQTPHRSLNHDIITIADHRSLDAQQTRRGVLRLCTYRSSHLSSLHANLGLCDILCVVMYYLAHSTIILKFETFFRATSCSVKITLHIPGVVPFYLADGWPDSTLSSSCLGIMGKCYDSPSLIRTFIQCTSQGTPQILMT